MRAFQRVKKGETISGEMLYRRKNGETIVTYYTAVPLEKEGKFVGAAGTLRDITEAKKFERALKEKVNELERLNKLMVGREIKMAELKEKIEELKEPSK
jgi:hypothetical protein